MTIVVLLILVVVWAAVLAPSLLRRRKARRSSDSIGEFHHHLRVLRRTGPVVVNPAFGLTTSIPEESSGHRRPAAVSGGRLILIRPDAPQSSAPAGSSVQRPDRYFRPEARKRRRDVLLGMVSVIFTTGVLGSIPVLRPVLVLTAVALVAAGLYVVMVVRLGSRASERTAKLRYLPEPMDVEPTIVIRRHAAR